MTHSLLAFPPPLWLPSFFISFAGSSLLPDYWGPGFLKASSFPFLSRCSCLVSPVSASLVFVDTSGSPVNVQLRLLFRASDLSNQGTQLPIYHRLPDISKTSQTPQVQYWIHGLTTESNLPVLLSQWMRPLCTHIHKPGETLASFLTPSSPPIFISSPSSIIFHLYYSHPNSL